MIRHRNDENSRPSCQISFLRNPPDSAGMTGFLQELGGHCKDLLHFAAQSCRLGPFSFTWNFVAETNLTIGAQFQPTYNQGLQEDLDLVLAHRQTFLEPFRRRRVISRVSHNFVRAAWRWSLRSRSFNAQAPGRGSGNLDIAVRSVKGRQVLFYSLLLVRHLMDFFFFLCRIGKNIKNGARKISILLPQVKQLKRCYTTCTWQTTAPDNRESENFVLLLHFTFLFKVKKYLSSSWCKNSQLPVSNTVLNM